MPAMQITQIRDLFISGIFATGKPTKEKKWSRLEFAIYLIIFNSKTLLKITKKFFKKILW